MPEEKKIINEIDNEFKKITKTEETKKTDIPTKNAVMNSKFFDTLQGITQYKNNIQRYINIKNDKNKNTYLILNNISNGIYELESTPLKNNKYTDHITKFVIGINSLLLDTIDIGNKTLKLNTNNSGLLKDGTKKNYSHNLIGKNDRTGQLFDYIKHIIYMECYKDNELIKNYITIPYKDIMQLMGYQNIESVKDLFEKLFCIYKIKYPYIKLYTKKGDKILTQLFNDFIINKDSITIYISGNTQQELKNSFWGNIAFTTINIQPKYYLLENKPYILVKYIKEIIRNDKTTTKKNITYRSIYNQLNLPETENNTRTKQTIKEPMKKLIANLDFIFDDNDYYIYIKETKDKNINLWLDKSQLIIMPNDQDKERNKEIKTKVKTHKKRNTQRKNKSQQI